MIITLDGPAGCGKTTVGQKLARKLGFDYLDTGAMYRAVTWWFLEKGVSSEDLNAVLQNLKSFDFRIIHSGKAYSYFVGENDVTSLIRSMRVTQNVSAFSAIKEVRFHLTNLQRNIAHGHDVVVDARDGGTVIFPDAEHKIFLTARAEVRAKRRYLEMKKRFPKSSLESTLKEIKHRDFLDSSRETAPLKVAENAIEIDTSDRSPAQIVRALSKDILSGTNHPGNKLYGRIFGQGYSHASLIYNLVLVVSRFILSVFYRLKVYGVENVCKGGAILAPTHTSYFDPPIVACTCPMEAFFLGKEGLFKIPLFNIFIRKLNTLPVKGSSGDLATIKTIEAKLKFGRKVVIFPEGSRSKSGKILPLKRGVAMISYKAKSKIIPIYINGPYKAWKRGQLFPKPFGHFSCVFGRPISWDDYMDYPNHKAAQLAMTNALHDSLLALEAWFHGGMKGPIP